MRRSRQYIGGSGSIARRIRRYTALLEPSGLHDPLIDARDRAAAEAIERGQDVPEADLQGLMDRIAEMAPPDAGLRWGSERRLADLGIVGHAIASSRTLGQAHKIWLLQAEESDTLIQYRSQVRGGSWRIDFVPAAGLLPRARRLVSEEWLTSFFAFLAETTGTRWPPVTIELSHARRPDVDYRRWLPADPLFRRPANRLTLPAALLESELRSWDDEMLHLILRHFAERPHAGYAERVRRHLMLHMASTPTLTAAAAGLGVSTRTLVRRLAEENSSFGSLLEEHRREYALILARDGRLGAKQIADVLGFRSHQGLRRAFVKWTGKPLGEWRRQHGA